MNEVAARAPAKWWNVAIGLALVVTDVKRIEEESSGRCIKAYIAIFEAWKRQESSPCTWRSIVECLQSPIVGEHGTTKQIIDKCM